ncbi:MAG: PASTA domain-containing protein [Bacteroidia bacterium]|jgi:beta-lactam-binding protein with PASTA domain|nr:PASTA domain-containing protein [Paludibacter sp.]NCB67345.1 PASTA domain-containing protein [Bacteroidia bacterium]
MDFKKFWNESLAGFVVKRVLLAITIFVALAWITLLIVDQYTRHGEFEVVPDLRGMYVEEAQLLLSNQGLYPQVIDSVYVRNKKLGTIIEQTPIPNSTVKKDRPIYIIINSRQVRKIPVPDVTDVSFRQADAMLKAVGLNVSGVDYKPSEYKDLVIDIKYRGKSLDPGTRIPENSYLTLVVGSGVGDETVSVPSLKGLTLEDARTETISASVIIGAIQYDVQPSGDEQEYFIYRQRPSAGQGVDAGSRIDVWLSKDKSLQNKSFEEEENTEEDEQFF